MSRYDNRNIVANRDKAYSHIVRKKGVRSIQHFTSPELVKITASDRARLQRATRIWKQGDRLWKLAAEFYNDPSLWWVIAWYNQKPTEGHFQLGSTVLIPLPIEDVLGIFER